MVDCDWCGAPMDRIGAVETGMMHGIGSVWLCRRDGCGHEREVFDVGFSIAWWRDELVYTLFKRMCDLSLQEREKRWVLLMQRMNATLREGKELLAKYGAQRESTVSETTSTVPKEQVG